MRQVAEKRLQFVLRCAIIIFVVVSQKEPLSPCPFAGVFHYLSKEVVP